MKKLKKFIKSKEFACFLVCLFLILFNWPITTIVDKGESAVLFVYLYGLWFIGIIILFFMGKFYLDKTSYD